MRPGQVEEPIKKCVCRLVLNEMMSQDACRLIGACQAKTASPQMRDQIAERGFFPNEITAPSPCNEINMDIRLANSGS